MYNFFGYFLSAYALVLIFIFGWILVQKREENRLIQNSTERKSSE